MSNATRSVRHRETIRPKSAPRGDHTIVNIDLGGAVARRPAPSAPVRDAASPIVTKARKACDSLDRLGDGLDRLQPIIESRKTVAAAAARDADLAAIAHYQGTTPAAVNAANKARWSR